MSFLFVVTAVLIVVPVLSATYRSARRHSFMAARRRDGMPHAL